jgi:hypothetical protein
MTTISSPACTPVKQGMKIWTDSPPMKTRLSYHRCHKAENLGFATKTDLLLCLEPDMPVPDATFLVSAVIVPMVNPILKDVSGLCRDSLYTVRIISTNK